MKIVKKIADNEKGASMIEYALIAVLIAIVCIAGTAILGRTTSSRFSSIGSSVTAAPN